MNYNDNLKKRLNDMVVEFKNNRKMILNIHPWKIVESNGNTAGYAFVKSYNNGTDKFYEEAIELLQKAIINQLNYLDVNSGIPKNTY